MGNGSKATPEFDSPLSVTLPAAVTQVAASPDEFASAAILATGRVEVWGSNAYGEAGPGAPNPSLSPHLISGLTGIIQVAVGGGHVLALDSAGTVWSWGNNTYGELGNGTTSSLPYSSPSPSPVPGINGIVQIAAGGSFSLALRGDGTVYAWGLNSSGQVGDGTTVSRDPAACVGRRPRLPQQPLRLLHIRAVLAQIQDITRRLRADRRGVPQILPQVRHMALQGLER